MSRYAIHLLPFVLILLGVVAAVADRPLDMFGCLAVAAGWEAGGLFPGFVERVQARVGTFDAR